MFFKPKAAVVLMAVLILVVMFIFSGSMTGETIPDDAVVRVNDSFVTAHDYEGLVQRYVQHYKNMYGVDLESPEMNQQLLQLQDMILQQLIINSLLLQIASQMEIVVTEEDIDQEAQEIMMNFPDAESFSLALEQSGYTMEEFREDMKTQVITRRLEDILFDPDAVAQEDVEEYYQMNKDYWSEEEMVHAAHILVETEEQALDLENYLEEGHSFQELAGQYSLCPSGSEGGDLGFFARGQMVIPFEEAAFQLAVGEVSGPVATDFGWHLITLNERKDAVEYTFQEIQDEVYAHYLEWKKQEVTGVYLEQAMEEAHIEFLD